MTAIGNPDTGSTSDAFAAFEAALAGGDPSAIATTAEAVLAPLGVARERLAPHLDSGTYGVGAREWDVMLDGIARGVTRMRDAGASGSVAGVEAGRAAIGDALRDHFYQGVYGPSADRWQVRWAWPDTRVATPSRSRFGNEAGAAFDGSLDSYWTPGDVSAPQSLELDLGRTVTLTGLRLLVFQTATGRTAHEVTISGPSVQPRELTSFEGSTSDRQWLAYSAPRPIGGVRVIRITTTAGAPLIGWREIEPQLAPASRLAACGPATGNLALDRPITTSASPGSKPARAVDGDPDTAWDAGVPAPASIEIDLGRPALIHAVRLLPFGPADQPIAAVVSGRDEAGHTMTIGVANQARTGTDWLILTGPTPCVGLRWVSVDIGWAAGTAGWREVEVLGTLAR